MDTNALKAAIIASLSDDAELKRMLEGTHIETFVDRSAFDGRVEVRLMFRHTGVVTVTPERLERVGAEFVLREIRAMARNMKDAIRKCVAVES